MESFRVLAYCSGAMIRFNIFNIPVTVQPWFWLTLAFLSGNLFVDNSQDILYLLLFLVAGFISILVHELGHALTARHFGKRVEIVLQAFGGYAAYSGPGHLSRKQSFLITAAGPAIQIVLGLAAWAIVRNGPAMNQNMHYFVVVLAAISLIWAVFNLLPILPMDGGRLLETTLGPRNMKTTLLVSCVTGALVCIAGFAMKQPFVGVFVGMLAYQSFKQLKEPSWR